MNDPDRLKKVLIIGAEVQPIPPAQGGAVEHLVDLLLLENEREHFADITVISPFDKKAEEKTLEYKNTKFIFMDGLDSLKAKVVDFFDLFSRRFFDTSTGIFYLKKVCAFLKENNDHDLIIVENRPLFGKHIRKLYKGPLYLHLHNDFINRESRHLKDIIGNYDRYVVISEFLRKRLSEVEDKPIDVLHNGIDLDCFYPKERDDQDVKELIYAGRLVSQKGVIELVKAFKKIDDNDIKLKIIGTYDKGAEDNDVFMKEFEDLIKDDNRIEMTGQIQNSETADHYRKAYAGIVPSIVNEALSLTAIEMLATGLPVICTDAGGLLEVVDDSCGIIISRDGLEDALKEALERLLEDKDLHDRLSKNAIKKAQRFSKDDYIEKMKKIIENA